MCVRDNEGERERDDCMESRGVELYSKLLKRISPAIKKIEGQRNDKRNILISFTLFTWFMINI